MRYASKEGRAHLEQNVHARSDQGTIRSDTMDLFFAPAPASPTADGTKPARTAATSSEASARQIPPAARDTGQQLTHATGMGNVIIDQELRHGASSRADYAASEGKIVLSGGPPRVYDNSGNSTSGRQLTLFLASDTIIVDSAEGVRTLTMHPVGK